MSLRQRLRLLLASSAVVLALIIVFGAVSFRNLTNAQNDLIDRIQVARITAKNLELALIDQETGLRGFVLSRDGSFLAPYQSGLEAEARARTRDRQQPARRHAACQRDLTTITSHAERWRSQIVGPALTAVSQGRDTDAATLLNEKGKQAFDAIRSDLDSLNQRLAQRRDESVRQFDDAVRQLAIVASGAIALIVVFGIVVTVELRRSVLRPVLTLSEDARLVSTGDLDHTIDPVGPEELRELATTMEQMREAITSQLTVLAAARADQAIVEEELRRSNRDLEQFAYIASHDLQEPLRKVAGFTQLLERRYGEQLDDRAREYIHYAVDGAERMQTLISDLLAFSRVGRTTARFERVDLGRVVADAWRDAGAEDAAALRAGPLPTVSGDPTLLRTLFLNLFTNAVKFRTEAAPHVEVVANQEDDTWVISVCDNGIGIPPEFADRIFDIFQRLHTRDVYEGTGIGLALCKRIAEFHGGHIRLVPHEHGARFDLTLPASLEERPVPTTDAVPLVTEHQEPE